MGRFDRDHQAVPSGIEAPASDRSVKDIPDSAEPIGNCQREFGDAALDGPHRDPGVAVDHAGSGHVEVALFGEEPRRFEAPASERFGRN